MKSLFLLLILAPALSFATNPEIKSVANCTPVGNVSIEMGPQGKITAVKTMVVTMERDVVTVELIVVGAKSGNLLFTVTRPLAMTLRELEGNEKNPYKFDKVIMEMGQPKDIVLSAVPGKIYHQHAAVAFIKSFAEYGDAPV